MLVPPERHLRVGSLLFEGLDQSDVTAPYAVLSRLPNTTCRTYAVTSAPVRDVQGLRLVPDALLTDAPQLDVLHIPGGPGQEQLMGDEAVLGWVRRQAAGATSVLSVCTGALILGAAGLLVGRRATTHWAAHRLLPLFGAEAVDERVVVDDGWVFTAGVTAGIDGALRLAAELRGDEVAQLIQLLIQYAPEPPFHSGTPETAPAGVLAAARDAIVGLTRRREETARRIGQTLGVSPTH